MSIHKPSARRPPRPSRPGFGARHWPVILIFALVAVMFALTIAIPKRARAQELGCGRYDVMVAHLEAKYHERRMFTGATDSGRVLVVMASLEGTWTILTVTAGGIACIVAAGDGWQPAKERSDG